MDDDASKGVRRRGGKRDGKLSRLVWSTAEEEALLECLREIVRTGWKSDNGFRTGYLGVLEQLLNKACPNSGLKAEPHISSKIHTTNTIDIKDDVFDNFAKIDSFAKTLRYKSFPYYAQWCEVFGKDRATGERGFDPILAPRNPSHTAETERSENVPVTPEYYVPTPDPTLYGDDEFMNSFASATAQPTVNRADTERVTSPNVLAWRLKNHRLVNKSGVSLNRFLI
ncbi:UNVERIFIED_CONTAM: hypothetical protein Scaly_2709600 [Sesamum calycinum]|uniref:Myb/SANT-like domain-containing protein n=1 Tax=Sesamum calycinum TaxID=2727403 RepID=A0AAW2J3L6_9LAMI